MTRGGPMGTMTHEPEELGSAAPRRAATRRGTSASPSCTPKLRWRWPASSGGQIVTRPMDAPSGRFAIIPARSTRCSSRRSAANSMLRACRHCRQASPCRRLRRRAGRAAYEVLLVVDRRQNRGDAVALPRFVLNATADAESVALPAALSRFVQARASATNGSGHAGGLRGPSGASVSGLSAGRLASHGVSRSRIAVGVVGSAIR